MQVYDKTYAEQFQNDIEDYLLETLPHGSGIDCDWTFSYLKNGSVLAHNAYHCMNDAGFYCGYADFTVKFSNISTQPATAFSLVFNGKCSAALNARHFLREYLEDTIYEAVRKDNHLTLVQAALSRVQCVEGK